MTQNESREEETIMKYDKQVMTTTQLVAMGFSRKWLMQVYRDRHLKIAWKTGAGGKTSTVYFDTEKLEKYREACCTGE